MSAETVVRPLWRSFTQRFLRHAVEHVRQGGHALVWRPDRVKPVAWMLLPCGPDGELPELAFWSLLALEKDNYSRIPRGVAKGLATMRVPRRLEWAVEAWCDRDAEWPGTTRAVTLDCTTCAACCMNNKVILGDDDFARWSSPDTKHLRDKAYLRRKDGKVLLRLDTSGNCLHLNDKRCGIYAVRPDPCRVFPAGSECCLSAREEEFDWLDGSRDD